MSVPVPHFLLYSHASPGQRLVSGAVSRRSRAADAEGDGLGRWQFELRSADGVTALEAADEEACDSSERLELIAIVRGLESLDQASRVTLFTSNRGIRSGLKYGLPQWRESDWQWERYGKLTPVKNGDLWRRIDRALAIHDVRCREGALDVADDLAEPFVVTTAPAPRHRTTARGQKLRIDGATPHSRNETGRSRGSSGRLEQSNRPKWLGRLCLLARQLARRTD